MTSLAATSFSRKADRYRDLLVIDRNAPRFNQTVVALALIHLRAPGAT